MDNFLTEWVVLTMDELWDLIPRTEEEKKRSIKPTFPTRRWGNITTKTATTDIQSINKFLIMLKENGFNVRKRICHETNEKYGNKYKFYRIEKKIK